MKLFRGGNWNSLWVPPWGTYLALLNGKIPEALQLIQRKEQGYPSMMLIPIIFLDILAKIIKQESEK